MIKINAKDGATIAEFTFCLPHRIERVGHIDSAYSRVLMETLRAIDSNSVRVMVSYPALGARKFFFNQQGSTQMNLADHVPAAAPQKEATQRKFFVAPLADKLPDDGMLQYYPVESVYDLTNAPDRCVLVFSVAAIPVLKCICENTVLFNVDMLYLSGVPGAEYTAAFDEAAWNLTRCAYAPLLSDLRHEVEVAAQVAAQNETVHDREKAHYTRANGSIKALEGVEIASPDAPAPDDADEATETEFKL